MSFTTSIQAARQRHKERGTLANTKAYLQLWYHGPPDNPLRGQYGNDIRKYLKAYQPSEEDFRYFQDSGMECFIKLEQRELRKMRIQAYGLAGLGLCEAVMRSAALERPIFMPNIVLVAIDFEGCMAVGGKGIGELGLATFQTKSLLSGPVIDALHYSLRAHRNRKFCFGATIRTHAELLPGLLRSFFADLRKHTGGQIILVCHSLQSELHILDDLGVHLEDIGITGVLDTYEIARLAGVECKGSLQDMLSKVGVPWRQSSLHCAGNDACYTLKLVLGLLQARFGDPFKRLEDIVRGPVPDSPGWSERGVQQVKDGEQCWELGADNGLFLSSEE